MQRRIPLDFDGPPLQLVEGAYQQSQGYQTVIFNQCRKDYLLYRAFVDMTNRDSTLPNIAVPKIYNIVETKAPQDVKALLGTRPYIPYEAKRTSLKFISEIQSELIDQYLAGSGFFIESALAFKLKTLYGVAFLDIIPYRKKVTYKIVAPNPVGGYSIQFQETDRLRFKTKAWAPWEIYLDPFATNLEESDGCRYAIKFQLTSKRNIIKLAEMGAYPGLDVEGLGRLPGGASKIASEHEGLNILQDFGLDTPMSDDDMGILMRYESAERYIDTWNGINVLRDMPNPFDTQRGGHGMINLSRITHIMDAHTQNRIWGIGEAKPNEVHQAMLNDQYSSIFRRKQLMGEPVIFIRNPGIDPDDVVWTTGNRIPVTGDPNRPITDNFYVHNGTPISADDIPLTEIIERNMDLTSGVFAPNRGEPSAGQKTLGEIIQLRETGSERQELGIRLGEEMYLKSVGQKIACHIEQYGTRDDFSEIVGPEKAAILYTANPADLPGGYNITFKGSNRVSNILIKQRNLNALAPQLMELFNAGQFAFAQILLESFEVPQEEIQRIILENQQLAQQKMQMQSMQMQFDMAMQAAQAKQKLENNNQKQIPDKAESGKGKK